MEAMRSYISRLYNWVLQKKQGSNNPDGPGCDQRTESIVCVDHTDNAHSHVIQIQESATVEDCEQKSHSADNAAARKMMEMQALHEKQVTDLLHEINALKERNLELSQKLSREWDQKISSSEADIENINIKNRPLNLVTDYQMMFSQDWLDMKTELDDKCVGSEEGRLMQLCDVLMETWEIANSQFADVMYRVNKTLTLATDRLTKDTQTGASDIEMPGSNDADMSTKQTQAIEEEWCTDSEMQLNNKNDDQVQNVTSHSIPDNEIHIQQKALEMANRILMQVREEWMLGTYRQWKEAPIKASDADIAETGFDANQNFVKQGMTSAPTAGPSQATSILGHTEPQIESSVGKGIYSYSRDFSSHLSIENIFPLVEQDPSTKKKTVIPRHLEQALNTTMGDILRVNADCVNLVAMEKMVCKSMIDKLNNMTHTDTTLPCDPRALVKYVQACCRLCWKMVLQRPPMLMETPGIGDPFNDGTQDLFYAAEDPTKTGVVVCYYIQPTLTHSGKVLVKGKVMTGQKAPEEQLQTYTLEELSSTNM